MRKRRKEEKKRRMKLVEEEELNQHHINFCQRIRSADEILDYYADRREMCMEILIDRPEEIMNYLEVSGDRYCLYQHGQNDKRTIEEKLFNPKVEDSWTNLFICSFCQNLFRLVDPMTFEINKPFIISTGKYIGKKFRVREEKLKIGKCEQNDKFNSTLTNILINWYLMFQSLPVLSIHMAFNCGHSTYILEEEPSFRHYLDLPDNYQNPIYLLIQLMITLKQLQQFSFLHGEPTLSAIVFDDCPTHYEFENIQIDSPYQLKFQNFTYSSLTLLDSLTISPDQLFAGPSQCLSLKFPSLSDKYLKFPNDYRQIQILISQSNTFISSAIEFYCFIVSLMTIPKFYQLILNDANLSHWWQSLWLTDYHLLTSRLMSSHRISDYGSSLINIYSILYNLSLRLDVLSWSLTLFSTFDLDI